MKLRSMLFVPADSESKLAKARASEADALILDLEDAVASGRKSIAREMAAQYLQETRAARSWKGFVRVNPIATEYYVHDLAQVVVPGLDGVVLPKADSVDDVLRLAACLDVLEARAGLLQGSVQIVVVATETAKAMLNLSSYARKVPRLAGITWGAEDLSAAIGAMSNREADGSLSHAYLMARSMALMVSAAAEVTPVDTLYANFRDSAGLELDCRESKKRGFSGRIAIHPDQVAIINTCYTPSAADVDQARAIVAAFLDQPEAGAIALDGKMYDRPHFLQAMRTVTQFDAATSV